MYQGDTSYFLDSDPYRNRRILSVIGCMLCHIVFGTCNIWGNIQVYVCSYLRMTDPTIEIDQIFIVSPIQAFAVTLGNIIGCWKCYPFNKGLVTSLIFCFNGLGTITSALLSAYIVNPDNKFPEIVSTKGGIKYNYYHEDVADNVPLLFYYFAIGEIVILVFALSFIWIPPYDLEKEDEIHMPWNQEQSQKQKLSAALQSKHFYLSYAMMFMAVLYFQYITIVFKPFGEFEGHNDKFLTFASSLGMIFNCVSRLSGGIILDKISFKQYFGFILFLSMFLSYTYIYIAKNDYAFASYLALSYFISGSIFVSMPIYYAKAFGPEVGSQCYAYFFTSNAVATLLFSFIVSNLSGTLGYEGMLNLTGASSTIALIILLILPSQPFIYKKNCLLYEPTYEKGPMLNECNGDFAQASIIMRKESILRRKNTLVHQSTLNMSRLASELHMPRFGGKKHSSINKSGFGDF
eukprot:403372029